MGGRNQEGPLPQDSGGEAFFLNETEALLGEDGFCTVPNQELPTSEPRVSQRWGAVASGDSVYVSQESWS